MIIIQAKDKSKKSLSDITLENINETLIKLKLHAKHDPIVKEICREHNFGLEIIDGIPLRFSDSLDVSAKTTNSEIELNKSLLLEPFEIIERYFVHELVHALQHMEKEHRKEKNKSKDQDYLSNPDELEAFQKQIKFDAENRGLDKAIEYTEELVDYHEIPKSKRDKKIKELLKEVKK